MSEGMGLLGWAPDVFWRATLPELNAALDGYLWARGYRKADFASPATRAELEELEARFG